MYIVDNGKYSKRFFFEYLVFLDIKCLIYVKSRASKKTFCKYLFVKIHSKYVCFGGNGQTTSLNSTRRVYALVQGRREK